MTSSSTLDTRLESRLRSASMLADDQLAHAHELTRSDSVSLAGAIVKLGIITESEMGNILESLQETRAIKLEDVVIDLESVKHVPARVARMHRCIPIRRSGNTLVVAMSDPSDIEAIAALRSVTDFEIMPVHADAEPIEHALYIHYGAADSTEDVTRMHNRKSASRNSWTLESPWECSIESFFEHDGVKRARDIAKIVASGNWEGMTEPILLVGPEGSGKTHLLTAISNYTATRDPMLRGLLTDGAALKSVFGDFVMAGRLAAFRFEVRDRSLLLLDDFYGAWGDPWVEEELAATIQVVLKNGGVVMVGLSVEQYFAGPFSQPMRELLARSTEVQMSPPPPGALQQIVESRCKNLQVPQLLGELTAASQHISWSSLRGRSIERAANSIRSARG